MELKGILDQYFEYVGFAKINMTSKIKISYIYNLNNGCKNFPDCRNVIGQTRRDQAPLLLFRMTRIFFVLHTINDIVKGISCYGHSWTLFQSWFFFVELHV